jgi:DNA invertase Pin-like site-specific DNA recombinase
LTSQINDVSARKSVAVRQPHCRHPEETGAPARFFAGLKREALVIIISADMQRQLRVFDDAWHGTLALSTDDQDTRLQTDALECAGCKRIFREKASGAKADRPELARLLETLREGDMLVVWKLDRLGSLSHLIELVAELEKQKVGLRSLTDNIDTTTASGRMFFHIMGALAQFERDLIRERTLAGLTAARAQGRFGGRPKALSPADLETARAAIAAGEDMHVVARRVGVSRQTLYAAGLRKHPPMPVKPPRARRQRVNRSRPGRKKR